MLLFSANESARSPFGPVGRYVPAATQICSPVCARSSASARSSIASLHDFPLPPGAAVEFT
jgi:hypothetical protein